MMARRDLVFRVFASSTFSDLIAERNALQERVFPNLRSYCEQMGARFQAIDLRWGVSEEAALDQQAMNICIEELKRCQQVSPRPNFIVLLGDRYGARPLPAQIPAVEFEALRALVPGDRVPLLDDWYRRDDNADPAEYYLRPRTVHEELVARDAEAARWRAVEPRLHGLLRDAAGALFPDPTDPHRWPYEESATHQEIRFGALAATDAPQHVYCYFRRIDGIPEDERASDYRDIIRGGIDYEAQDRLVALKGHLERLLPHDHVYHYATPWNDGQPMADLDALCARVEQDLTKIIDLEVAAFQNVSELDRELEVHEAFARERATHFIGREDALEHIRTYVQSAPRQPLVVHGVAGSGKTALIAKAIERIQAPQIGDVRSTIVARFIGATPSSSDLRSLLFSLCTQIGRAYGDARPIPNEPQALEQEFRRRLAAATVARPLVLLLDALDQLQVSDWSRRLEWVPWDLPEHVRLIFSVLEADGEAGAGARTACGRVPAGSRVLIKPLSRADGESLLGAWLRQAHRTLQADQRRQLLTQFEQNGLPLYLKLAFEQARRWRSHDLDAHLSADVPGLVSDLLAQLEQPRNHGFLLTSRALGCLAAGRYGLAEDELLDVLSDDDDVLVDFRQRSPKSPAVARLPVIVWARLYGDLGAYLTERSDEGTRLTSFYHRQIGDVVRNRYLNATRINHAGIAGMLQKRGRAYGRTLTELPYHLRQARMDESLYALIDDASFRDAQLARTNRVYTLCNDVLLAFEAAIDEWHLPRIAHYGFLHADYFEGRRGQRDILALYERDLPAARQELLLYSAPARFRLLLLLAIREVVADRLSSTVELVDDILELSGVTLPDVDADFVTSSVALLVTGGCCAAPKILRTAFGPEQAALQAGMLAQALTQSPAPRCGDPQPTFNSTAPGLGAEDGFDEIRHSVRYRVLSLGIQWFSEGQRMPLATVGRCDAFRLLARQTVGLTSEIERTTLLAQLDRCIESIPLAVMGATDPGLAALLVAMLAMKNTYLESSVDAWIELRPALSATLGAVLVGSGQREQGLALLTKAVEGSSKYITEGTYGALTTIVNEVGGADGLRLFRKLLANARGDAKKMFCITTALGDMSQHRALDAALADCLQAVNALGLRGAPALLPLARAAFRAGWGRERDHDGAGPLMVRHLATAGSLIAPEVTLENIAQLSDYSAMDGWALWENQAVRRSAAAALDAVEPKKAKAYLYKLLNPQRPYLRRDQKLEAFQLAEALSTESMCAEACHLIGESVLCDQDAAIMKSAADRVSARIPTTSDGEARCRLLDVALRLTDVQVEDAGQPSWGHLAPQGGEWRVKYLGRVAGYFLSRGAVTDARSAWYDEALSAQRVAVSAPCFASYVAAAGRASDSSSWRLVVDAATTQDPWRRADLVQSAAEACDDRNRLADLEKLVTGIGAQSEATDAYLVMQVALGRAWIRLGDPLRGVLATASGLAIRQREGGSLIDSECESIREFVELCQQHEAVQLVVWLLVGQFERSWCQPTHSYARIIATCAASCDQRWARRALTALYRRLLECEKSVISSVWVRTAARTAFALGLDEGSQTATAAVVATEWTAGRYRTADQWMTNTTGRHRVQAVTALCALALLEARWSKSAFGVAQSGESLDRLRKSTCAVLEAAQKEFGVLSTLGAGTDAGSAIAAWSLAEALAQTFAADNVLGVGSSNAWEALEALAKGRAESGHLEIALALARDVSDTKHRDQLMYELAKLAARQAPSTTLQVLNACTNSETRRKVGVVAAGSATLQAMRATIDPLEPRPDRNVVLWRVPTLGREDLAGILGLVICTVVDGVIYLQLIPWIRMALSRAEQVGVAVLVTSVGGVIGWKMLAGSVKNPAARLIGGVLLLPLVPLLSGFAIDHYWLKLSIMFRRWGLQIRSRYMRSNKPTHSVSEPSVNREVLRNLFRATVIEAGTFDVVLAAAIARTALAQDLPDILNSLPGLSMPHGEPERIRMGREWRARHSRVARFRRGFLLVPTVLRIGSAIGRDGASYIWRRLRN